MQNKLRLWLPLSILTVMGALAGAGSWLEAGNFGSGGSGPAGVITVTSRLDRGPGSLRTAIFDAMKMSRAVSIELAVDRINLDLPLPPIATTDGTRIIGLGAERTLIRLRGDADAAVPVFKLLGNKLELSNVAIEAPGGTAITVSGQGAVLANVSVANARTAVSAADIEQLEIHSSTFRNNFDGVRIEGKHGNIAIRDSSFEFNRNNGIWVVFGVEEVRPSTSVSLHDNSFRGGRDAIVAGNAVIDLRDNRLREFTNNGMVLLRSWATVSGNRIVDSQGIGMHLSAMRDSQVIDNEIGRNELVGIIILDAEGLHVDGNKFYANGYGIAAVGRGEIDATLRNNLIVDHKIDGLVAIGRTPLIDGNHALRNRQAGIRIMDLLLPDQPAIVASQRLANNVMSDNGENDVQFGQYVVQAQ